MHISLFDYNLPKDLIAYYPSQKREESKMLVYKRKYKRKNSEIIHSYFKEILNFLEGNELIVANNVKVIPARIFGKKETGGKVEILLVRKLNDNNWEAFLKASKRPKLKSKIEISDSYFCEVLDFKDNKFIVKLPEDFNIEKFGKMPLPPYIKREVENIDFERYQTVFANEQHKGAIAAPTAGLHFSDDIIEKLKYNGIEICYVTLYVSYATFEPVRVENIEEHKMHYEDYEISEISANKINKAMKNSKKILAVGTTVVRTLEDNFLKFKKINYGKFSTNLFIYPGFKFNVVNKLLTNFHLPKSTLLMLVSAFAGRENILRCYREAISKKYRFFSYGDCMLII